jgi:hypothetical protein
MTLLLLFVVLLGLVALPVVAAIRNPIVNVADDLNTATPYAEVDSELAQLLGGTRGYDVQLVAPGTSWSSGVSTRGLGVRQAARSRFGSNDCEPLRAASDRAG